MDGWKRLRGWPGLPGGQGTAQAPPRKRSSFPVPSEGTPGPRHGRRGFRWTPRPRLTQCEPGLWTRPSFLVTSSVLWGRPAEAPKPEPRASTCPFLSAQGTPVTGSPTHRPVLQGAEDVSLGQSREGRGGCQGEAGPVLRCRMWGPPHPSSRGVACSGVSRVAGWHVGHAGALGKGTMGEVEQGAPNWPVTSIIPFVTPLWCQGVNRGPEREGTCPRSPSR